MAYLKHPVHGNKHVDDSEVAEWVALGYVQWPRTKDEKALGDGSDAAYWRKKYERDIAQAVGNEEDDAADIAGSEPAKRRGRPPRV